MTEILKEIKDNIDTYHSKEDSIVSLKESIPEVTLEIQDIKQTTRNEVL